MSTQLYFRLTRLKEFREMLGSQDPDLLERTLTTLLPEIHAKYDEYTGEIEYHTKLCRAYLYEMIYNGKVWSGKPPNVPIELFWLYGDSEADYWFWGVRSFEALLSQATYLEPEIYQRYYDAFNAFQELSEYSEFKDKLTELRLYMGHGRYISEDNQVLMDRSGNGHNWGYWTAEELNFIINALYTHISRPGFVKNSEMGEWILYFYDSPPYRF